MKVPAGKAAAGKPTNRSPHKRSNSEQKENNFASQGIVAIRELLG